MKNKHKRRPAVIRIKYGRPGTWYQSWVGKTIEIDLEDHRHRVHEYLCFETTGENQEVTMQSFVRKEDVDIL